MSVWKLCVCVTYIFIVRMSSRLRLYITISLVLCVWATRRFYAHSPENFHSVFWLCYIQPSQTALRLVRRTTLSICLLLLYTLARTHIYFSSSCVCLLTLPTTTLQSFHHLISFNSHGKKTLIAYNIFNSEHTWGAYFFVRSRKKTQRERPWHCDH